MIFNKNKIIIAFIIIGISNNLDYREDDFYDGYDIINELIEEKDKN